MKSLLLLFLASALLFCEPLPQKEVQKRLRSKNGDLLTATLKQIKAEHTLIDDADIQKTVITMLHSESYDPNWSELAESEPYELFYGELLETTKLIASRTGNRQAWIALITANYNASSQFGRWLGIQPQVIPLLIEYSSNQLDTIRSRMMEVMAYTVVSCRENPRLSACGNKIQLKNLIRWHAENDEQITPAIISAYNIFGAPEDIPLLETLRTKFPNVDEREKRDRGAFIDMVERRIREGKTNRWIA